MTVRNQERLRLALLTAMMIVTLAMGISFARDVHGFLGEVQVKEFPHRPPPRDWRPEVAEPAYEYESMYGRHARAPSVDHMFMRSRPSVR